MGNSSKKPKTPTEDLKIIVVGDGTTGKTSLVTRYVDDQFYEDTPQAYIPSSLEIKSKTLEFSKTKVTLNIYDLGGQETFQHLRKTYCPNSHGVIISFGLENPTSFQNVQEKWVADIKKTCPGVPVFLVGNKRDLRDDAERKELFVTTAQGKKMASKFKMKYFETSSLLDEGLGELFDALSACSFKYKAKQK